jgi:predicted XRE-type DNA-binding protein
MKKLTVGKQSERFRNQLQLMRNDIETDANEIKNLIVKKIRDEIKRQKLSPKDISGMTDIHIVTVGNLMNGKSVGFPIICKLLAVLNIKCHLA